MEEAFEMLNLSEKGVGHIGHVENIAVFAHCAKINLELAMLLI